ncbi:hypothetical protein HPP92_026240 [Vanilla planifolia]|uniref:Uncharacterized protein n=1 Tax=Vanilla planifolia TaxID=51239 RepID=A0A835U846_VANPL|nr:hypothetical protein HPP92_026240 [Vanilla planifolia]
MVNEGVQVRELVNCVQYMRILSPQEVQQMSLDGDLGNGILSNWRPEFIQPFDVIHEDLVHLSTDLNEYLQS